MGILNGSIKKELPIPLYYQLKEIILHEISSGNLKPGDCLPTENEFMESYDLSRSTVRQAILDLVGDGYLCRRKGKGTFVSVPKVNQAYMNRVETYNDQIKRLGITPTTRVVEFRVVSPDEAVCKNLNISPNEKVIHLIRIRYADEEPIVIADTYMPYAICGFIMEHNMVEKSLYEVLAKKEQSVIVRATRTIQATSADREEANMLQVKRGHAVQVINTVAFNKNDIPIEYTVAKYRGDRNTCVVETQVVIPNSTEI